MSYTNIGADTSKKEEVTLSEAISLGYLASARLVLLANVYLVASAGQAVANKVFNYDKLLENPLNSQETQPAIGIWKWGALTAPRLLSEALAKNDVHRFRQVQKTTKNFADMIFKELPLTYKDNNITRFYSVVVKGTASDVGNPAIWPWWLQLGVGVTILGGIASIYRDLK